MRIKAIMLSTLLTLGVFAANPILPDPKLTPGATLDVPLSKLCVKGYASSVRNVPQSVKNAVYAEYHVTTTAGTSEGTETLGKEYEVDHLISLELGGSNDIKNLWPQSYTGEWNAHVKDALEDRLHALVCAANPTITLEQAQKAISSNWIKEYKKVFGVTKPKGVQ
jgi:hypothetical protein